MSDKVFIILFRGVGGATQLPVKPLREKLEAAGFRAAATYINSGNAIVASELPRDEVVAKIAGICRKEFGFDKDIHAVTRQEWAKLIKANPFPEAVKTPKFLHAAVLATKPDDAKVKDVPPPPPMARASRSSARLPTSIRRTASALRNWR